jgi:hypothetical protein
MRRTLMLDSSTCKQYGNNDKDRKLEIAWRCYLEKLTQGSHGAKKHGEIKNKS